MQVISVVLMLAFIFLIMQEYRADHQKEELVPVYAYEDRGVVQYGVFLKPNTLYSNPSLPEGNIYITELVDHINATFEYDFKGERPAGITGSYEIIATIEGNMNNTEDYSETGQKAGNVRTIWKKERVLVPRSGFETDSGLYSINKSVTIDYHEYNGLSREIIEITKLNIPTRLIASMNVNILINTANGTVEENHAQSIVVPLGTNSFEIQKNEIGNKPGSLDESITIQMPVNMRKVYGYGIGTILMLILLVFVTFFIKDKSISEHVMELNRIFKKYGSRLVAVNTPVEESCGNNIKVKSMEDLLKLADEMSRPIIYRYSENPLEIFQFFILSNSWTYEFNLKESMNGNEKKSERKNQKAMRTNTLKTQINYKSRVRPDPTEGENADLA